MSAGRSRLEIGTYCDIGTTRTSAGTVRAEGRFRDWDGEVRKGHWHTAKRARQSLGSNASARVSPSRGLDHRPVRLTSPYAPVY
jgi:hypothetical protein